MIMEWNKQCLSESVNMRLGRESSALHSHRVRRGQQAHTALTHPHQMVNITLFRATQLSADIQGPNDWGLHPFKESFETETNPRFLVIRTQICSVCTFFCVNKQEIGLASSPYGLFFQLWIQEVAKRWTMILG